jgi:hypothetical protein
LLMLHISILRVPFRSPHQNTNAATSMAHFFLFGALPRPLSLVNVNIVLLEH